MNGEITSIKVNGEPQPIENHSVNISGGGMVCNLTMEQVSTSDLVLVSCDKSLKEIFEAFRAGVNVYAIHYIEGEPSGYNDHYTLYRVTYAGAVMDPYKRWHYLVNIESCINDGDGYLVYNSDHFNIARYRGEQIVEADGTFNPTEWESIYVKVSCTPRVVEIPESDS